MDGLSESRRRRNPSTSTSHPKWRRAVRFCLKDQRIKAQSRARDPLCRNFQRATRRDRPFGFKRSTILWDVFPGVPERVARKDFELAIPEIPPWLCATFRA
jgi:hypothetical protein